MASIVVAVVYTLTKKKKKKGMVLSPLTPTDRKRILSITSKLEKKHSRCLVMGNLEKSIWF